MKKEKLKEVLELHQKWLNGDDGGKRADLRGADLNGANLRGANLRGANLRGANLRGADLSDAYLSGADLRHADLRGTNLRGADLSDADLSGANLRHANLRHADLIGANLRGADLRGADLSDADLSGADLRGADLRGADLTGVAYDEYTVFLALQCPEKGDFIGYKKANSLIVELLVTEDSKRSSATTRKCRCSKAKILSITNIDNTIEHTSAISDYDKNFKYVIGEVVEVENFDNDRWNECAPGIHFFITRQEAVNY
jgi:hypothetical protein